MNFYNFFSDEYHKIPKNKAEELICKQKSKNTSDL